MQKGYANEFYRIARLLLVRLCNYTCECCHQRASDVQIHHIDCNVDNADPLNLLVVCKSCHHIIHKGSGVIQIEREVVKNEEFIALRIVWLSLMDGWP